LQVNLPSARHFEFLAAPLLKQKTAQLRLKSKNLVKNRYLIIIKQGEEEIRDLRFEQFDFWFCSIQSGLRLSQQ
jgi:hypothetical protein